MKHFTYRTDKQLPTDTHKRVGNWARRRKYHITFEVKPFEVSVSLDTQSTWEHNSAVESLARILDRASMSLA